MASRIGVGVIGCGTIADAAHLPSYSRLPDSKLVAVTDINGDRARMMAEKYGAKAWYTDYHEMLCRNDLQAVSICTPPHTHAEITLEAAENKKHILCEKPMALKLGEADAMIKAAEQNGVKLMISFPFRFDPSFQHLRNLIQKGIVGKPLIVNAVFGNRGPSSHSDFYWDPERGGGVIQDIGVHHVDLLRWLIGEISDVFSVTSKSKENLRVEDNAVLSLMFENGALGTLSLSWTYPYVSCRVEIVGERGTILTGLSSDLSLHLSKGKIGKKQGVLTILVKSKKFYFELIKNFMECVRKGQEPSVNGFQGKKALEIVLKSLKKPF